VHDEAVDAEAAEPGYDDAGGFPKEIQTYYEEDRIEDTGYKYPFP
jgi:hypothetical protein